MGATRTGKLLMRLIPKYPDLSGVVSIQGSSPFWEALRIDDIPFPQDAVIKDGPNAGMIYMRARGLGASATPYRVNLPAPEGWTGKKFPSRCFALSSNHTNHTLYFLAEFWRQMGIPFVGIANKHGNTFRPAIYQGTWLASLAHR